jgi:hypothetical protein
MDWTRSETVALAASKCVYCQGLGLKPGRGQRRLVPCNCVFREIFRLCFNKFKKCAKQEKYLCHVSGEIYGSNGQRRLIWGRKIEEYIADFYLVSKRTLTEEEWPVFNAHYLMGADWRLCCAQLKMDKGNFFHAVYRIQQKLGRAFREVAPYALFPLDEYFKTAIRRPERASRWEEEWRKTDGDGKPKVQPLRPPLRRVDPAPPPIPAAVPEPETGRPKLVLLTSLSVRRTNPAAPALEELPRAA